MIEQTLRQTFGYDSLRPGQEQAIRAVVAGRSAAAIFPTGSANPCATSCRRCCCRT